MDDVREAAGERWALCCCSTLTASLGETTVAMLRAGGGWWDVRGRMCWGLFRFAAGCKRASKLCGEWREKRELECRQSRLGRCPFVREMCEVAKYQSDRGRGR